MYTYSCQRIGKRRFFHSNVLICQDKNIEMVSVRFYTICIGLDQGVISGQNTHINSHTDTHIFTHKLILNHINLFTHRPTNINTQTMIYTDIHTQSHLKTHSEVCTEKKQSTAQKYKSKPTCSDTSQTQTLYVYFSLTCCFTCMYGSIQQNIPNIIFYIILLIK